MQTYISRQSYFAYFYSVANIKFFKLPCILDSTPLVELLLYKSCFVQSVKCVFAGWADSRWLTRVVFELWVVIHISKVAVYMLCCFSWSAGCGRIYHWNLGNATDASQTCFRHWNLLVRSYDRTLFEWLLFVRCGKCMDCV